MIKPATCWYRYDEQHNEWKYNHYEIGLSDKGMPFPKSEQQEQWYDWKWAKKYGYYQHALGRTKLIGESDLIIS